jgi:hypothetical protein
LRADPLPIFRHTALCLRLLDSRRWVWRKRVAVRWRLAFRYRKTRHYRRIRRDRRGGLEYFRGELLPSLQSGPGTALPQDVSSGEE